MHMTKTTNNKRFQCCLCGKTDEGYGNNPQPIQSGMCCDECNMKYVIPVRIALCRLSPENQKDESYIRDFVRDYYGAMKYNYERDRRKHKRQ